MGNLLNGLAEYLNKKYLAHAPDGEKTEYSSDDIGINGSFLGYTNENLFEDVFLYLVEEAINDQLYKTDALGDYSPEIKIVIKDSPSEYAAMYLQANSELKNTLQSKIAGISGVTAHITEEKLQELSGIITYYIDTNKLSTITKGIKAAMEAEEQPVSDALVAKKPRKLRARSLSSSSLSAPGENIKKTVSKPPEKDDEVISVSELDLPSGDISDTVTPILEVNGSEVSPVAEDTTSFSRDDTDPTDPKFGASLADEIAQVENDISKNSSLAEPVNDSYDDDTKQKKSMEKKEEVEDVIASNSSSGVSNITWNNVPSLQEEMAAMDEKAAIQDSQPSQSITTENTVTLDENEQSFSSGEPDISSDNVPSLEQRLTAAPNKEAANHAEEIITAAPNKEASQASQPGQSITTENTVTLDENEQSFSSGEPENRNGVPSIQEERAAVPNKEATQDAQPSQSRATDDSSLEKVTFAEVTEWLNTQFEKTNSTGIKKIQSIANDLNTKDDLQDNKKFEQLSTVFHAIAVDRNKGFQRWWSGSHFFGKGRSSVAQGLYDIAQGENFSFTDKMFIDFMNRNSDSTRPKNGPAQSDKEPGRSFS